MNGYFAFLHVKPFSLGSFVPMQSFDILTEVKKLQPDELYRKVMPREWQDQSLNCFFIGSETYTRQFVVLS